MNTRVDLLQGRVVAVGLLAGAGCVLASFAAASQVAAPDLTTLSPSQWSASTILIVQGAGFLSLLLTNIFQMMRDSRNRKWDQQDRHEARLDSVRRANVQRVETIQAAVELAKLSKATRQEFVAELSKNTELTEEVGRKAAAAHTAANQFNEKLEHLKRVVLARGPQLDSIEDVAVDTNIKVSDLKGKDE